MSIVDRDLSNEPLPVQALQKQMQEISDKILAKTPDLKEALTLLHKNLLSNEALVHIMDDEDIYLIHQAHEQHKGVRLMLESEKAAKKSVKRIDFKSMTSL